MTPGAWSRGRITKTPWLAWRIPPSAVLESLANCAAATRALAVACATMAGFSEVRLATGETVGERVGNFERLQLNRSGVDAVASEEAEYLVGAAGDLGLRHAQIVAGGHLAQRPQGQIGSDLLFSESFHLHVAVSGPAAGKALADEESAEAETQGENSCRNRRAL